MSAYSNQLTAASYTTFAQASTNAQLVTGPGILRAVNVLFANTTAPTDFYDGTTTGGTKIFSTAASAAKGVIYNVDIPFTTGLFVDGSNAGAGSFSILYDAGSGV